MKNNQSVAKNKMVISLLRRSILQLCKASIPEMEEVEVDAILCLTLGRDGEELIVKIHETLWNKTSQNTSTDNTISKPDFHHQGSNHWNENVSACGEDLATMYSAPADNQIVSIRTNKRKSTKPQPLSSAKQPCIEVESEFGDPLEVSDEDTTMEQTGGEPVKQEPPDYMQVDNYEVKRIVEKVTTEKEATNVLDPFNDSQQIQPICIEPNEVYVCDTCKQCFDTYTLYSQHMQSARHCKVNTCQYCNRKFTNFNSFVFHMRSHGTSETAAGDFWKGKPLRCGVCTVLLRSKRGVVEHMRGEHHYVKCYTCTTCEEIYPNFNTFRLHREQMHAQINQCRCEMCELFFTFTEYKDHEKECMIKIYMPHSQENQPIGYGQNAHLPQQDLSSDTNVMLNSNNVVPSENLGIFEETKPEINTIVPVSPITDANRPPLPVKVRSPPFKTIQTDASPIIKPMEGPFRCQSCFSVFQFFEQYETHNHEMHSRFVCSYCAQSFATRRNLQRHARRHTGVRPYQCMDCECNYTRDDDLKKHMVKMNHLTGYKLYKSKNTTLPFQRSTLLVHTLTSQTANTNELDNKKSEQNIPDTNKTAAALEKSGLENNCSQPTKDYESNNDSNISDGRNETEHYNEVAVVSNCPEKSGDAAQELEHGEEATFVEPENELPCN